MSRYIVVKKEKKRFWTEKKTTFIAVVCVVLVTVSAVGGSMYALKGGITDAPEKQNSEQGSTGQDAGSLASYDFMAIVSEQAKANQSSSSSGLSALSSLIGQSLQVGLPSSGSLNYEDLENGRGGGSLVTSGATSTGSGGSSATTSASTVAFSNGITASEVLMALPTGVASVFMTLDDEGWKAFDGAVVKASKVMNLKKSKQSLLTDTNKDLLCTILCQEAIDQGSFSGDALSIVATYRKTAVMKLQESEKNKYSTDVYSQLANKSQGFASMYKSGTAVQPGQLVMYNQVIKLNHPLIMYNSVMMASVNDLYQYVDSACSLTPGTATIAIKSRTKTVEYTAGTTGAYSGDKSVAMDAPMICINDVYYIPVKFFADVYSIDYVYLKDERTMVLYNNLNQLDVKGSANNLSVPVIRNGM